SVDLTWWNTQVKTVGHDAAYGMPWETLMKMMTNNYCPRNEIKKLEMEIWDLKVKGLPDMIHGSVVASKPKTMQEAVAIATELMDQKFALFLNVKWRVKGSSRIPQEALRTNNNNQTRGRTLARSPAATNNHKNPTCYECGNQGHYRSDFPELKNQDHGNQAGGTRAYGMVHALKGGETNKDPNDVEDDINA
nr:hypothetical protein [Tanacetum cinerariifolium]